MADITVLNSKFEKAGSFSTNVRFNAEEIKCSCCSPSC